LEFANSVINNKLKTLRIFHFESRVGAGATFAVTLPLGRSATLDDEETRPAAAV
jgi:hypothetical protein